MRTTVKEQVVLDIGGMTCAACSNRIEKVLSRFPGVTQVRINLALETAYVSYTIEEVTTTDIIHKVEALGYTAVIQERGTLRKLQSQNLARQKKEVFLSVLLCLPLLWAMMAHFTFTAFVPVPSLLLNPWIQFLLATPIQFYYGMAFYKGAYYAMRNRSPNMDVLVILGTTTAYIYSVYLSILWSQSSGAGDMNMTYFETSAFLITFIKLGKWLEALTKGRTGNALEKLANLQVKTATVLRNGVEIQIPIEAIHMDDVIRLKPGERVPIDGEVLSGSTYVDQSMMTGESKAVYKAQGDLLFGATLNKTGSVTYRVNKKLEDTALHQIIQLVSKAQSTKPPIQRVADVISEFFVGIVIIIAFAAFIIWYIWLTSQDFGIAMQVAVSVLVIACPCALGLATPTSIMAGSGRAAELGILFKRSEQLERLHKADTVVFDKTGTLTRGKPVLTDMIVFAGEETLFLQIVASAETLSEHPIAAAILEAARERDITLLEVTDFTTVPGCGIQAKIGGNIVMIGNGHWLKTNKVDVVLGLGHVSDLEETGKSVIFAAINGTLTGLLAVTDQVRDSAVQAVRALNAMGKEVIMLTGDGEEAARVIAKKAGIQHVIAGVLPDGKAQVIRELKKSHKRLLMVGDGINDAPALATANYSMALSNGTDIAMEAADITIIHDNLMRIPQAIQISQMTIKNIKQNLAGSLIYNAIGIPIAMAGMLMPYLAGAAMALSSVTVILNALRLQKMNLPRDRTQGGESI
ncbi:heavy metal translocating P-type ATPase [Paenibacillus whitsoniae]|uniref:P-type Cu(+) transporter n=1 Tax=Paenibacillus whitsoniae TaxID=2496558 RepID=A0A3S0BP54_9BACL|nr:heavy metal translocating P-type ATPase [Paenibacillus whitsoniae]RTE11004.1 copper-translocating P-type ATPase [Paenibacillus whitsoniae]